MSSAFFEMVQEISNTWNTSTNSALASSHGISRTTLPSLMKLNKEWKIAFHELSIESDELRSVVDQNSIDLAKKCSDLKLENERLSSDKESLLYEIQTLNYKIENLMSKKRFWIF